MGNLPLVSNSLVSNSVSQWIRISSFLGEFPNAVQPISLQFIKSIRHTMGQGLSTTQFFVYGRRHFTKTGYEKHIKSYASPPQSSATIKVGEAGSDGIDLGGKVVVVTGANSGLGKELATYAAAKGAKLYMLCRSKERAEKARAEIAEATGSDTVSVVLADLSEMSQVRKAASDLQAKEGKVDALVCNAGVLLNDRRVSSEGNELTFGSHLLGGSFLLSNLLLPQLKASADGGRVVFVSSGGMYNTKFPDWETATSSGPDAEKNYNGQMAYAYAKRGQVLLAERYSKTNPEVTWVSCHPGWVDTPAVDEAYGSNKKYLEPMRTGWQGAEGIGWLISADKADLESGQFYLDRKPQAKHIAGPFMTEGSFTKNTEKEVDEMIEKLKEAAGLK